MKYLLLLLLPSCIWLSEPTVVDEELRVYVERFYYEADIRGVDVLPIRVELGNLDFDKEGVYRHHTLKSERIIISRDWFVSAREDDVEQVIFHELGHHLGRGHNQDKIDSCSPVSIMCTGCCFGDYQDRREELLNELFKKEPL